MRPTGTHTTAAACTPRPITGARVFACLAVFFGIVIAMNVVLVRVALSSFGGVETESAYKAGLAYGHDIAAARAQDDMHWSVRATLAPEGERTRVTVVLLDGQGREVVDVAVEARLAHPTDKRRDLSFALAETGPGRFDALTEIPHGQWDLLLDVRSPERTLFRSKSRITL